MYSVLFSQQAHLRIDQYSRHFFESYRELYFDSGLSEEKRIIDQYRRLAHERVDELYDLILSRLKEAVVMGRKDSNTLTLIWRNHYLILVWREFDARTRLVERLEIV